MHTIDSAKMRMCVDYSAIRRNAARIRSAIGRLPDGSPTGFHACLKANAYGFGAKAVAAALADDVDGFQIGLVEDALAVLQVAGTKPVLLLATVLPSDVVELAESGLIATVHNQAAVQACVQHRRPLDLAIQVNAGLERLGILPTSLPDTVRALRDAGHRVRGIYTHIPFRQPEAHRWAQACMREFDAALHEVRGAGLLPHDAFIQTRASSWVGSGMAANDNTVAVGHLLYGFKDHVHVPTLADLESPLRTLKAKVIDVHDTRSDPSTYKGSYFSGGMPARVAIISGGLVNGLLPMRDQHWDVHIGQVSYPVVGISLENLIVDVSAGGDVPIGAEVTICSGEPGTTSLTLSELARLQGMTEPQLAFFLAKLNIVETNE